MPSRRLLHPFLSSSSSTYPDIPLPPCLPTNPICDPTSSLPPVSDTETVTINVHSKSTHHLLRTFLITSSSLLFCSLLLLLLLFLYRRRRRNHSHIIQPLPLQPQPNPNPNGTVTVTGDDNNDTPHHIWLIRTVGLDDSVINSIPVTVYKSFPAAAVKKDAGDCPVCLGEFEDGEAVKLLPKCAHAFHQPCIDTWLRSHVNCPLCRAAVVVVLDQESSCAADNNINQEECVIDLDSGAAGSSSGPLDVNNDDHDEGLQPIRRSVSMDASQLGMLMMRVEAETKPEEKNEREIEIVVTKNMRGSKADESFRRESSAIKRSMSSRSGRLFFTKYGRGRGRGRGRSASLLPAV